MKRPSLTTALVASAIALAAAGASAQSLESLRGAGVETEVNLPEIYHQQEQRFTRNYRLQPPLVPHTVDRYQVDLRANQCLSCHDWSRAGEKGAPTLSMTHYQDRNGNQLDKVSGTRWFCTQCHVPQVDAPDLVDNTFTSSGN